MDKKSKKKTQTRKTGKKTPDIMTEFSALGKKVEGALRAAAGSKQVREIPKEVVRSLRSVGDKIHQTLEEIACSEEAAAIRRQAKKVCTTGRKTGAETSRKARANIAAGLKAVSEELGKLAGRIGGG